MENHEEDNLGKLIKNTGGDKPGGDFNERVMKLVNLETEKEFAVNSSFQTLLQGHLLIEQPSHNFNRKVMQQITPSQARNLEPIISRNAWYVIAASVVLCMVFYVFVGDQQDTHRSASGLEQFLTRAAGKIEALPILYPAIIFCVGFLILADYILRESTVKRALNI